MAYESNKIVSAKLDRNNLKKGIMMKIRNRLNPADTDWIWVSLRQAKDMKMIPSLAVTDAWLKHNVVGHSIKMAYA